MTERTFKVKYDTVSSDSIQTRILIGFDAVQNFVDRAAQQGWVVYSINQIT